MVGCHPVYSTSPSPGALCWLVVTQCTVPLHLQGHFVGWLSPSVQYLSISRGTLLVGCHPVYSTSPSPGAVCWLVVTQCTVPLHLQGHFVGWLSPSVQYLSISRCSLLVGWLSPSVQYLSISRGTLLVGWLSPSVQYLSISRCSLLVGWLSPSVQYLSISRCSLLVGWLSPSVPLYLQCLSPGAVCLLVGCQPAYNTSLSPGALCWLVGCYPVYSTALSPGAVCLLVVTLCTVPLYLQVQFVYWLVGQLFFYQIC